MLTTIVVSLLAFFGTAAGGYVQLNNMDITAPTVLNPSNKAYVIEAAMTGELIHNVTGLQDIWDCSSLCATIDSCVGFVWGCTDPNVCSLMSAFYPRMFGEDSCYFSGFAPFVAKYDYDVPHMASLCDATKNCAGFSTTDGMLYGFGYNDDATSYISNTTCGAAGPAKVETGTCGNPSQVLVVCENIAATATFKNIATLEFLSPSMLEQACDQNKNCVGFVLRGTEGQLLEYAPTPNANTGSVAFVASAF